MSLYGKIYNSSLCDELRHELNTDVLLLGADGFAYFGHLQAIEDGRLAILTPAITAATSSVEIVTPSGCLATVDFVRVDLCSVIAKGTGIVDDPVYCLNPCCQDVLTDCEDDDACGCDCCCNRQDREYECWPRQLRRLIGDTVAITTVGGFLFEGILSDVSRNLAILTLDELFIPGTSGYVSDRNLRSAVVNLEAISSIATNRCRQ